MPLSLAQQKLDIRSMGSASVGFAYALLLVIRGVSVCQNKSGG
jgi:hypothetical protein